MTWQMTPWIDRDKLMAAVEDDSWVTGWFEEDELARIILYLMVIAKLHDRNGYAMWQVFICKYKLGLVHVFLVGSNKRRSRVLE